jgi:DNA-binding response OmpR family regulator
MPENLKPRVLVVEDDDVTQTLFRRYLERSGFEVAVANNGLDAFAITAERPPDAVILDLMMPKMDGFGFLQALRASPAADLPVIVTSALADAERKAQALALGVKEYMVKTKFTLNELVDTVRRHLRQTEPGAGVGNDS